MTRETFTLASTKAGTAFLMNLLAGNKLTPDHVCPDCGRPLQRVSEDAYFFKMFKYADRWMKYIEEHPDFIQPESRRNEMIQFVKSGLEDLCVSRTSFTWGIPVPFDPKHVDTYGSMPWSTT